MTASAPRNVGTESTELLRGAYDLHVHTAPDVHGVRLHDDLEYATIAREAGMGGAVLKSHHSMTADRAWIARKLVSGIDLYGGLCLDAHVGGITPSAVDSALRFVPGQRLCRVIWMPTINSAEYGRTRHPTEPGYRIVDDAGKLLPDVITIIELIRDAGIAMATGHIPLSEQWPLLKEAKRRGLERVIVTHVDMGYLEMDVPTQIELSKYAYLEHCVYQTLPTSPESMSMTRMAEAIKAVGASRCIMSTDLGQAYNIPPVEGFRYFIAALLREGISGADVRTMVTTNPRAALGIDGPHS